MPIIGIGINRQNPAYTKDDFVFWMPQFEKFFFETNQQGQRVETEEGTRNWNVIYPVVNAKVFKSILGSDWSLGMALVIAHYLQLRANQLQAPSGSELEDIAGGGTIKGVLASASVGGFSKSYDINKTVSEDKEAKWWNQTSYGAAYWALLSGKPVPAIFVVTSNPVPGAQ